MSAKAEQLAVINADIAAILKAIDDAAVKKQSDIADALKAGGTEKTLGDTIVQIKAAYLAFLEQKQRELGEKYTLRASL